MATVTYHDLDRSAPRVEWLGYEFLDGRPVEVTSEALVAKARENAFFEVAEAAEPAPEAEKAPGAAAEPAEAEKAPRRTKA